MLLHRTIVDSFLAELRRYKEYGEKCFAQLRDEDLLVRLNAEQNSIAAIVKHLAGNMRSRFTDFFTTNGEKPDRDREGEFTVEPVSRREMLDRWNRGWALAIGVVESLKEGDLERTVKIRGETLTVSDAILRQIAHYASHIGQIMLIAKHVKVGRSEPWDYMTVAPGKSVPYVER